MLQYAVQHNLMRAYQSPRRGSSISYLLFVDDCLLMARAIALDVAYFKVIVDAYYDKSDQAVNFSKSRLKISPKTPSRIKNQIQSLI